MSLTTYRQCLQKLVSLHAIKFGLKSTKKMVDLLGNPERNYNIVHIAGTCGKGSVANKISHCLKLKGYKVGLFTSPHICSFRERIRINDELISEDDVISYTNKILDVSQQNDAPLTFFEMCTVMAFNYFAEKVVDWAVIETGMGGAYDATNVVEHPNCTVITSIGWDHMAILGDTFEKISIAKAGIMKSGCPVVLGPSAALHQILFQKAYELDCEVFEVKPEPRGETVDEENTRIAAEVVQKVLRLEFLQSQLKEGVSHKMPLRLQVLTEEEMYNAVVQCRRMNEMSVHTQQQNITNKKDNSENGRPNPSPKLFPLAIILDVGHNETALDRLSREIGYLYYGVPVRFVVCLSKERSVDIMEPIVNHFHAPNNNRLAGINYAEATHVRIKPASSVAEEVNTMNLSPTLRSYLADGLEESQKWINTKDDPRARFMEILSAATLKACEEGSVLVVCGTFFMMKETLECFDLVFGPVDPIEMNEPSMVIKLSGVAH